MMKCAYLIKAQSSNFSNATNELVDVLSINSNESSAGNSAGRMVG
ncbi:MAG: hypothetical protein ACYC6P_07265 [Ignavibacteriaceae bacterium]